MSAADIDRLAEAILVEVWDVDPRTLSATDLEHVIAGDNGAGLDLTAVVRALLIALRQPSESMIDAACSNSTAYRHQLEEGWADMIDTLLGET